MKRVLLSLTVLASTALIGCGGSVCERLSSSFDRLETKAQPCAQGEQVNLDFDVQQCENNVKNCTDADRQALTRYAECIDRVSTCAVGQEEAWATSVANCVSELQNISASCGGGGQ